MSRFRKLARRKEEIMKLLGKYSKAVLDIKPRMEQIWSQNNTNRSQSPVRINLDARRTESSESNQYIDIGLGSIVPGAHVDIGPMTGVFDAEMGGLDPRGGRYKAPRDIEIPERMKSRFKFSMKAKYDIIDFACWTRRYRAQYRMPKAESIRGETQMLRGTGLPYYINDRTACKSYYAFGGS